MALFSIMTMAALVGGIRVIIGQVKTQAGFSQELVMGMICMIIMELRELVVVIFLIQIPIQYRRFHSEVLTAIFHIIFQKLIMILVAGIHMSATQDHQCKSEQVENLV
jgi:hypothetical protein